MDTSLRSIREEGALRSVATGADLALTLKILQPGQAYPAEYEDLRRQIFVDERRLTSQTFYENDANCSHLLISAGGRLAAAIAFGAAEDTDFNEWGRCDLAKLKNSVFITRAMVHPSFRGQGFYRLSLYLALSQYRRQGRRRVVAFSEIGDTAARRAMDLCNIPSSAPRRAGGYDVECVEGDIDYVMWKTFEGLPEAARKLALAAATDEIAFHAKAKVREFYRGKFYTAVMNKTLTKQQYLEVLANTYCYVQWTTRVLAHQLVNLQNREVFKEIAHHLAEEIGHPEMIIHDMRQCGASEAYLEYVVKGMVANYRIDGFMMTQESAAAFRRDPVAFMGIPVAIEGVTAFMPPEFAPALVANAASWGLKEPKKACTFWASHVIFDNPENGHWARTTEIIQDTLENERQVRQIKNYIENVLEHITAGYDDPFTTGHS